MSLYRLALVAALLGCGGQIDPNASDQTKTRTNTDTKPSAPTHSGSTLDSLACNGSGIVPFEADFEDGNIPADFTVNTPSAFDVDYDSPLEGNASLLIEPTRASFVAMPIKNACAARLQFTLRADARFLAAGSNVARINAGSRRFTIFVGPGGVFLLEEVSAKDAVGMGSGPPLGVVKAEEAMEMSLDVDLRSKKATFGMKSASGVSVSTIIDMAKVTLSNPAAITSAEIGTTPGVQATPEGRYWVDQIYIN
jgi:hypothetical protein